jgi:hypothetical protein
MGPPTSEAQMAHSYSGLYSFPPSIYASNQAQFFISTSIGLFVAAAYATNAETDSYLHSIGRENVNSQKNNDKLMEFKYTDARKVCGLSLQLDSPK